MNQQNYDLLMSVIIAVACGFGIVFGVTNEAPIYKHTTLVVVSGMGLMSIIGYLFQVPKMLFLHGKPGGESAHLTCSVLQYTAMIAVFLECGILVSLTY